MILSSSVIRPVGLALGGGAARGIAHIGVLRAVEELEIRPSYMAGTSAGAIAACLWAGGMSSRQIESWLRSFRWRSVIRPRVSRRGLFTMGPLDEMLSQTIGSTKFEDLEIPLAVVATSIITGEPVVFTAGPLAPALAASCCVPGIFAPVPVHGDLLVDGGFVANTPMAEVRALGARAVIAVDLGSPYGPSGEEPSDMLEIILISQGIMERRLENQLLRNADLVIAPDLSRFSMVRADRISERVAAGYCAARDALASWGENDQRSGIRTPSPNKPRK